MAISERIHFFRTKNNMTMKELGNRLGFSEKTADVRIAQYETAKRLPKADTTEKLAAIFNVSPEALNVPDIDSYTGLMHTLFALEDMYGLYIDDLDGELCLRLDKTKGTTYATLFEMLFAWNRKRKAMRRGELSKDDYDTFRYNFRLSDTDMITVEVPREETEK